MNRELDGHSVETAKRIVSMLQAIPPTAQSGTAEAQSHSVYYRLEDLERDADVIVVAEAVRTTSEGMTQQSPADSPIQLLSVHLQIRQNWSRSTIPSGTIVMEQPVGGAGHEFPEYHGYTRGSDYLLFMRGQVHTSPETGAESTVYSLVGPQGCYRVNDGKLEAPEFPVYQLSRELDGETLEGVEARVAELQATDSD